MWTVATSIRNFAPLHFHLPSNLIDRGALFNLAGRLQRVKLGLIELGGWTKR